MKNQHHSDATNGSGLSSGAALADKPGLAHVRVRRHDPSRGGDPYYDEFDGIPYQDRSVLDVLHVIYQDRDPSLAYRHVCTKGFCGSCMLVVNGVPVMACQYPALPEMTIDPHPRFSVVRDLVVDLEQRLAPDLKASISVADKGTVTGGSRAEIDPERCVHCQDCIGVCPVTVYSFIDKRVRATDPDSCLGPSCNMCIDTCWKMAIRMVPRSQT